MASTAYVDDPEERAWLAPRLAALLGAGGAVGFAREDLFAAWTTFFERVGDGTEPVVLMIDDAQYADEGLLLFVEHLLAAAPFPCFVMLLTRPELLERPPEPGHQPPGDGAPPRAAHRRRRWRPWSTGWSTGLPDRVRDALVQRAEGIPPFAVETVRALIDRDLVVPRGGAYVLADREDLDLDDDRRPGLAAGADLGPPGPRWTPTSAAWWTAPASREDRSSRRCWPSCVPTSPDLDAVLATLVRAEILTVEHDRLSSEQGRYQFVQSVVRQVAYATLSRRDRKVVHLRLLEAMSREATDELAPVAAQHCIAAIEAAPDDADAAELAARAVGLLRRAAERARALGAPGEAIGHLARAAELATDERQKCEIQLAEAEASNDAGKYEQAATLAEAACLGFRAVAEADGEALAAAAWSVATTRLGGDVGEARARMTPYVHALQDAPGKEGVLGPVLHAYLLADGSLGGADYPRLLQTIQVAERLGDRAMVAQAINNLAVLLMRTGNDELGAAVLEKGTSVARECHDIGQLAHGLGNLASTLLQRDAVAANRVVDEAVEASRQAGIALSMSIASANLAIGRWATGDWDVIEGLVGSETLDAPDLSVVAGVVSLVLAARGGDPGPVVEETPGRDETRCYLDVARAMVQTIAGDREAVATVSRALDGAFAISEIYDDFALVYGAAVQVAVAFGDPGLIERMRQMVDEYGSAPPPSLAGHRALLEGLAPPAAATDDVTEAAFTRALGHYVAWGSRVHAARARGAYGVWLLQRGRPAEAEPLLAEARAAYADFGAVAWLEELEQGLAAERVGT